jgi:hypothetical protein
MSQMIFEFEALDVELAMTRFIELMTPAGIMAFLGAEVGPYLRQRARNRFAAEGDDVVGQWAPLAPSTVAIREGQQYPGEHPINRRTGEMENWVVDGGWDAYPFSGGGGLVYPQNEPTGTLREKVQTAQAGSASPLTQPRPVLGVNENDMLFVTALLAFSVEEALA